MTPTRKLLEQFCGVLVWIPSFIAMAIGGFFVLPQMARYMRIRRM
jgi:hypothetical protein